MTQKKGDKKEERMGGKGRKDGGKRKNGGRKRKKEEKEKENCAERKGNPSGARWLRSRKGHRICAT